MLKLGVIDVLNVLPVYYGILEGLTQVPCEIVTGKVTELNDKLNQGELSLSVVSSFEYARNYQDYLILPDLSVSARGAVKSIYLFSQVPLEELQGETIRLTEFSLTSVHLVQYLLQDLDVTYEQKEGIQTKAEIMIADEAIHHFYQQKAPYIYDLGELWFQKTGLPFVFALWVVRKEVYEQSPEKVLATYRALLKSKELAPSYLQAMAEKYNKGIFPDAKLCQEYLENLHYEFSEEYQKGFNLFQQSMVDLGKLPAIAPLQFISID